MGSSKEHLFDMQEERFMAWAAEHYPDVSPDTPAWEQIGNYYSWEQEAREEQFIEEMLMARYEEDVRVKTSLESIEDRYHYALSEIAALDDLLKARQPELVWRMGIVHSVSVLDAFLMYCARALLNHDWPLRRFRDNYFLPFARDKESRKTPTGDLLLFRDSARRYVAAKTFQSEKFIQHYFSTVMHYPGAWPLFPLVQLNELRNDLVHRGGYTKAGSRVDVSSVDLRRAVDVVRAIIETAMASLRLEQEFFRNGRHEEEKAFVSSLIGSGTSPGGQP